MFASLALFDPSLSHRTPCFTCPLPLDAGMALSDELTKPLLLIAEDDVVLRRLLTATLEHAHYRVIAVANGAEAVRVFQQHKVDLVILDIMMPVMDGLAACTQIRALSTVPILLLSAFSSTEVKYKARRSGASLFLNKPIRPAELKQHIQTLLQTFLFATTALD
jgi:DNA-binding response OmpR family regulator